MEGLGARRRCTRRARVRLLHPQQAGGVGRLPGAGHAVRARAIPRDPLGRPARWSTSRSSSTRTHRRRCWRRPSISPATRGRRARTSSMAAASEPADGWSGAIVVADEDPEGAFGMSPRAAQARRTRSNPSCSSSRAHSSWSSSSARTCSTTSASHRSTRRSSRRGFATCSAAAGEGRAPRSSTTAVSSSTSRRTRPRSTTGRSTSPTWSTSCSSSSRRTPARCSPASSCSRGSGGTSTTAARATVDVHVRRLRAKLGEEHAGLIQTVRSVGYRFGQTRTSPG